MEFTQNSRSRLLHELDNYDVSNAVLSRWETYNLTENPIDFEIVAYEAANVRKQDTVLDAGSSDGLFLDRMLYEFGHTGTRIGMDVKYSQFLRKNYAHIPPKLLDIALEKALPNSNIPLKSEDSPLMHSMHTLQFSPIAGDMNSIPLRTNSVDKLFSLFMMYHIPSDMQSQAILEAKRVLKPDGTCIVTTSSKNNKFVHRLIEADIAENLGVEPPLRMNEAFTTEIAELMLPKFFKHIYKGQQNALMTINESNLDIYMNSQRSLYNQYYPVPDFGVFEQQLFLQKNKLIDIIQNIGTFSDFISRSIFVASDTDIEPDSTQIKFKKIY